MSCNYLVLINNFKSLISAIKTRVPVLIQTELVSGHIQQGQSRFEEVNAIAYEKRENCLFGFWVV
jgi:hypothetical protein